MPREIKPAFKRDFLGQTVRYINQVAYGALASLALVSIYGLQKEDLSLQIAWVNSAAFFGLLLSFFYVMLGQRFSQLSLIRYPELLSRLSIVLIPLATEAWHFTAIIVFSHGMYSISVPVTSTVYEQFFPTNFRASLIAVGRAFGGFFALFYILFAGNMLEGDPRVILWCYPAIGLLGCASTMYFCSLKLPGTKSGEGGKTSQKLEAASTSAKQYEGSSKSLVRAFYIFEFFQFIMGLANLASLPVVTVYILDPGYLGIDEANASWIVRGGAIWIVIEILTLRMWSRIYDRLGIVQLRLLTNILMGSGTILVALCEYVEDYEILGMTSGVFFVAALSSMIRGFGHAGGHIAWLLAALSFSRGVRARLLQGVHTFLTGIRGIAAPFMGRAIAFGDGIPLLGIPHVDPKLFFVITGSIVILVGILVVIFVKIEKPGEPKEQEQ
ncbi:MAG: MFS transporter [Planctomycetes bacterium]|nr:MFS transporter [Planctomycetota bacterium]